MPAVVPVSGVNRWDLPEGLIDGQQALLIGLQVPDTFRPDDADDDRVLGIGLRRVALHREAAAICPVGILVPISGDDGDRGMLTAGWHSPEPWGCWSSAVDASLLLRFVTPLQGAFALELDMLPPLLDPLITLSVNKTMMEPLVVVEGINEWLLPQGVTNGQTELAVHLIVPRPIRPKDVADSPDERILGVGVRSLRLRALHGD
jgi:hypothetical protein